MLYNIVKQKIIIIREGLIHCDIKNTRDPFNMNENVELTGLSALLAEIEELQNALLCSLEDEAENSSKLTLDAEENSINLTAQNRDHFPPLEHALQQLLSPQSDQNHPSPQEGGAVEDAGGEPVDSNPSSVTRREHFNNLEIRRMLSQKACLILCSIPPKWWQGLGMPWSAPSQRLDTVIQLELVGEHLCNHELVTLEAANDVWMVFQDLLDRLVQSDMKPRINCTGGVKPRNPTGGGERKVAKTLGAEILKKKSRHLYMINNRQNQLCFVNILAHLSDPMLTDSQAVERGKELQCLTGLNDQTPVTFSNVRRFEDVLNRKIVVLYRTRENRALCHFETDFPKPAKALFLILFQNHYYGVKYPAAFGMHWHALACTSPYSCVPKCCKVKSGHPTA